MTARLPERHPAEDSQPRKVSQADILRTIGETGYRFVRHDQTIYAVAVDGGPVARPIRSKGGGVGTGSLRQCLIREFVLSTGRTPSQAALADALASLEALAMDTASQEVHLRVAPDPEDPHTTWLDLGHTDGTSVCIEPGRWSVLAPTPAKGRCGDARDSCARCPSPNTPKAAGRKDSTSCVKSCP